MNRWLVVSGIQIQPLFEKIIFNQGQIRTLTQLRDTLLPKLMSGEVRVRN
jgi:type I restriction enzyme S subunit